MKHTKDKILYIAFLVCLLLVTTLFTILFDFFINLLVIPFLIAPYLFIGIQYLLPRTKRTSIVVNKRIVQTAMLVFIVQIIVFYALRINEGLFFLILIALFAYLIFFLRSMDSLIKNWKIYRGKSKMFNCILLIYNLPLLYIIIFLSIDYQTKDNLLENENSISIKNEDIRFINAKTGKEMDHDSVMKPEIDSIIENNQKLI